MKRFAPHLMTLLVVFSLPLALGPGTTPCTIIGDVWPAHTALLGDVGPLPLFFVPNAGQTDPAVYFQVQTVGGTAFFTRDSIVLSLPRPTEGEASSNLVRMVFLGANPTPTLDGVKRLPGVVNFLLGDDPGEWRSEVPTFAGVVYRDLYPGIDLHYDGEDGVLKGTYIAAPGADPRDIRLGFDGVDGMEITHRGELLMHVPGGEIRQARPTIYQEIGGVRKGVAGGYVLRGHDEVGFQVADYEATRPLVIDPALGYATFLGGNYEDAAADVVVDSLGNIYVTGNSWSSEFPAGSPGPDRRRDAFVVKLSPDGQTMLYVAFLGGDKAESGAGIALGGSGQVYVTGYTSSTDFPRVNATQSTYGGGIVDAFLVVLNASGSALEFSTYLGGSGADEGQGVAACGTGIACVAGFTSSSDLPTTGGSKQPAFGGGSDDGFVSRINVSTGSEVYTTYLGGTGYERAYGVACDGAANAYVVGETNSPDFPATTGAFQTAGGGDHMDGFVTRLNGAGSAHVYSTYLGGSSSFPWAAENVVNDVVIDASSQAYVTGYTNATDFPTTVGAYDRVSNGDDDAFVSKLNGDGSSLVYSTYLGGSALDWGKAIAVDDRGSAYVAGDTWSANLPTKDAFQAAPAGGTGDAFVAQLDVAGADLVYGSYLGGSGDDWAAGIAVDDKRNAYVVGATGSTDFPTVNPFQAAHGDAGSYWDAFVVRVGAAPESTSAIITPGQGGQLLSASRNTAFFVPAGAFAETVRLTHTPSEAATATGALADAGYSFDLTAVISDTGAPAQLVPGATYTTVITYTTSGPAIEETLALYTWDGAEWVEEPTSEVNAEANTVTATPNHLSLWAVLGETRRVFLPLVLRAGAN